MIIETSHTFLTEREARIFMLGYNLGVSDEPSHAEIDPQEPEAVNLNLTEDGEADFIMEVKEMDTILENKKEI